MCLLISSICVSSRCCLNQGVGLPKPLIKPPVFQSGSVCAAGYCLFGCPPACNRLFDFPHAYPCLSIGSRLPEGRLLRFLIFKER
nr:MAG TPA: hypothetical protein [Caudoviricetes sp.]